ncbi:TRAP transporter small permease [Acuticoccus sp.]|uniref:TRAP transporter small permease n=1 Tax=Acuticoccus sp. TaxID=1904378 RepID=UPI003B51FE2A
MLRVVDAVVAAVTAALVAATVVITCTAVVFRYLLDSALPWPEEIASYLLVWISFFGAYLALRREGHISFDMLLDALPRAVTLGIRVAIDLVLIGFFGIILVLSVRMISVVGWTEIETAAIPQGVFMAVLPIASALLVVALVADLVGRLGGGR